MLMENFRVAKNSLYKKYDKADKKLQRVAGTIGALIAITGAITAVCSWVSHQFGNAVSAQISDFQQEVRAADRTDKQAATRIELMVLMNHDPENIVAIERMAKYYFQELDGDLYMTQLYSEWAKEYGGDTTIVVGGE